MANDAVAGVTDVCTGDVDVCVDAVGAVSAGGSIGEAVTRARSICILSV